VKEAAVVLAAVTILWIVLRPDDPAPVRHVTAPPAEAPPAEAPPPTDAADHLANLASQDVKARRRAADALVALGEAAVPGLIEQLRHEDPKVIVRALGILRKLGRVAAPAVPELLRLVREPNVEDYAPGSVKRAALDVFEALGSHAKAALPTVVDWFLGADEQLAWTAGFLVANLGRAAEPALPRLLDALKDEKMRWERGQSLIGVVEAIGPGAIDAAPYMLSYIHGMGVAKAKARESGVLASFMHTDFAAARALAAMGVEAVPLIIEAFKDEVSEAHFAYGLALREMGETAVPGLVAALKHGHAQVRALAADTLADMKVKSDAIRVALESAVRDPDATVRGEAAEALARQDEAAIPALIRALRDPNWIVQRNAARGLRRHGKKAADAVRDLIPMLSRGITREDAAKALGAMGERAADAVPALIAALADDSEYTREDVAAALGRIGAPAVPAILDALVSDKPTIRTAGAQAIALVQDLDAAAVAMLAARLDDPDPTLQLHVALALKGRDIALPALVRGLTHENYRYRANAGKAVAGYGKRAVKALPALFDAGRQIEREYEAEGRRRPTFMDWADEAVEKAVVAIGPFDLALVMKEWRGGDDRIRGYAANALLAAGAAALPPLRASYRDGNATVRLRVVTLMHRMPTESKQALMRTALRDASVAVRIAAARAVWEATKDPKQAVPVLLAALESDDETAKDAAYVIQRIGKHAAFAEAEVRARLAASRHHMVVYYLKQTLAAIDAE